MITSALEDRLAAALEGELRERTELVDLVEQLLAQLPAPREQTHHSDAVRWTPSEATVWLLTDWLHDRRREVRRRLTREVLRAHQVDRFGQ